MRLFEALDILNVQDTENNTQQVSVCPDMIEVKKNGKDGFVKIGIPGTLAEEIALRRRNLSTILIVVDLDAYKKIDTGTESTDAPPVANEIPAAIAKLIAALNSDPDYRESWKANIAVAVQSAYNEYFAPLTEDSGEVHESAQIHAISNNAADNFLNVLTLPTE